MIYLLAMNILSMAGVYAQDLQNQDPVTKPSGQTLNPGKESGFEVDYNGIKAVLRRFRPELYHTG